MKFSKRLEQWALAAKQKEDDNLALERYTRADEVKINALTLQIEKLTKLDLAKKVQLENEQTETAARQIELDRTAQEFRQLHAERQQLVKQWKDAIDAAQRRDAEIQVSTPRPFPFFAAAGGNVCFFTTIPGGRCSCARESETAKGERGSAFRRDRERARASSSLSSSSSPTARSAVRGGSGKGPFVQSARKRERERERESLRRVCLSRSKKKVSPTPAFGFASQGVVVAYGDERMKKEEKVDELARERDRLKKEREEHADLESKAALMERVVQASRAAWNVYPPFSKMRARARARAGKEATLFFLLKSARPRT